jgi:hypothetical protein
MRRKSLILTGGLLLLLLGGTAAALVVLVRHEPSFYADVAVAPGKERTDLSRAFQAKFFTLLSAIKGSAPKWAATFTQDQINSYFEEDFLRSGIARLSLPDDICAPRVKMEQDRIRLAFQYGRPPWNSIISIDFRVWLAPKEPNVIALELQGVHAGSLPISSQSLLEKVSEIARRQNIEVTWYRHNGNPVALLHFVSTKPRPTVVLQNLVLQDGALTLGGVSTDQRPRIHASPVAGQPPQAN